MTKLKSRHVGSDRGSALLAALLASSLLACLGLALAGVAGMEITLSANYRAGSQLAYAADAGAEVALADLLTTSTWTDTLNGTVISRLSGSSLAPAAPGASPVTLAQMTAAVQQQSNAAGSFGTNSPQWRLFAHGWLSELSTSAAFDCDEYLVAWIADDAGETDGNPNVDSNNRVQLFARALSPRGTQHTVAVTVGQTPERTIAGTPGVRLLAWREVR